MKVCTCGHIFADGEQFCPDCGNNVNEVPESAEVSDSPISLVGGDTKAAEQRTEEKREDAPAMSGGTPDAASIFSIFDGQKKPEKSQDKPDEPKSVKRPEKPKPGPNVEVKPMANAAKEAKFDPMKTPPPIESRYSLLTTGASVLRILVLLLPGIGLIYSIILTMSAKKDNVRTLGTAFLAAYMLQLVIVAAGLLVFALLYENTFDRFIAVMEYVIKLIVEAFQSL